MLAGLRALLAGFVISHSLIFSGIQTKGVSVHGGASARVRVCVCVCGLINDKIKPPPHVGVGVSESQHARAHAHVTDTLRSCVIPHAHEYIFARRVGVGIGCLYLLHYPMHTLA